VPEAIDLLGRLGDEAKLIAGGQSLVPMMNLRLSRPSALIDVSRLGELDYVRREGRTLRIGAMTRHRALEVPSDPSPLAGYEVFSRAARFIGHHPIRTMGTFGGSIAHADSASEWCLLAVLLDAEVVARGPSGERSIPAGDFFQGFLTTALAPDEIVVEVRVTGPVPNAALHEYARRPGDFGIVVVGAALDVTANRIDRARVAVGGVDAVPIRLPEVESLLRGAAPSNELFVEAGRLAHRQVAPVGDAHASAGYRRRLTGVLLEGALVDAARAAP
jgi:carbon-monoxide dehydrogenase medium subunit